MDTRLKTMQIDPMEYVCFEVTAIVDLSMFSDENCTLYSLCPVTRNGVLLRVCAEI